MEVARLGGSVNVMSKLQCSASALSVKQMNGIALQIAMRRTVKFQPVAAAAARPELDFTGMHHVGMLCENLERSLEFYQGILGLELNPDRPADKLPYRGAWFWVGDEMIHLMELPNPDPVTGRPEHGGRDRHACVAIRNVEPLRRALEKAGEGLIHILAEVAHPF